jgi:Undecaprenyl-phosphate glucose phosphotransferase
MTVSRKHTGAIGAAGFDFPEFPHGTRPREHRLPVSWSIVTGIWVALDSIAIIGSGTACYFQQFVWSESYSGIYVSAVLFVWLASLLLSQFAGLTEPDAVLTPSRVVDRILMVGAVSFLFLLALAFSLKVSEAFSRVWVFSFALSAALSVILVRLAGAFVLRRLARSGLLARRVAIFGATEQAAQFISHFRDGAKDLSRIVGVFDDHPGHVVGKIANMGISGNYEELIAAIRAGKVDDAVVAIPWASESYISEVVNHLREFPINVYLAFDLVGYRYQLRGSPSHFAGLKLVEVVDAPLTGWKVVLKAAEDRILALLFLILLSPAILLIYLAVRLESPGPAFFRQTRYGFNNKPFVIYKFRSMRVRDETEEEDKTVQAVRDDPRVTRIGRILRRTSLDELPQLLNVLNGTMSLVGPRPHAVDHNEEYAKLIHGYFARHNVKPGITGLAQVNGLRGETNTVEKMKERVRHDIHYTEHWSMWLDFHILFKTACIIWFGKNAY